MQGIVLINNLTVLSDCLLDLDVNNITELSPCFEYIQFPILKNCTSFPIN